MAAGWCVWTPTVTLWWAALCHGERDVLSQVNRPCTWIYIGTATGSLVLSSPLLNKLIFDAYVKQLLRFFFSAFYTVCPWVVKIKKK